MLLLIFALNNMLKKNSINSEKQQGHFFVK
jgi:hypothetical protein